MNNIQGKQQEGKASSDYNNMTMEQDEEAPFSNQETTGTNDVDEEEAVATNAPQPSSPVKFEYQLQEESPSLIPPIISARSSSLSIPSWNSALVRESSSSSTCVNNNSSMLSDRIVLTSGNHSVIHHAQWGKTSQQQHQQPCDTNDNNSIASSLYPYYYYSNNNNVLSLNNFMLAHGTQNDLLRQFVQLLLCLLLVTILAWFSAMDAKNQCISHQAYAVYDMWEDGTAVDEENQVLERKSCKAIFRWVMIPVCATTAVMGVSSILLIFSQQVLLLKQQQSSRLEQYQGHYQFSVKFLLQMSFIGLAWSYGILSVMLWPRYSQKQQEQQISNNPYQSLAAVDFLGHVGDNANLYYTSWIGLGLSIALVYQAFLHAVTTRRQYRLLSKQQDGSAQENTNQGNTTQGHDENAILHGGDNVEAMLSSFSTSQQYQSYRKSRATWYNSVYKLRRRTGIWMAALLATLVVVAASVHVFGQVLYPTAMAIVDENQNNDVDSQSGLQNTCSILYNQGPQMGVPAEMCARTTFALSVAAFSACLQLGAIVLHLLARQDAAAVADVEHQATACHSASAAAAAVVLPHYYYNHSERGANKHIPLKWEFVLSVVLSNLLGLNAVLATGVQGPAAKVGNLYYASWLSFLLCLRICLGCLEELYHIKDEEELTRQKKRRKKKAKPTTNDSSKQQQDSHRDILNTSAISSVDETSSNVQLFKQQELATVTKSSTALPTPPMMRHNSLMTTPRAQEQDSHMTHLPTMENPPATIAVVSGDTVRRESFSSRDVLETKRANRLRSYFFLGIFSTVCVCAGLDAAYNTTSDLTTAQRYMIVLPAIVAITSTIQFLLCLHSVTYVLVSSFLIGGILSVVTFCLCLADLILTMHSESSWAVNAIGDIQMANMYYFTWASIITAGLQMVSYTKDKLWFFAKEKDLMVVVWLAVNKVCFVIIGAGLHIWHTISDTCGIAELQTGAVTFCSRTVFAIFVGLTGIAVGSMVVLSRMAQMVGCCSCSRRVRAHVEAIISMFLMVLFGIAVAIITGIGGPGQSVGDMYYATWLAFVVSITVGVNCYDQIKLDEMDSAVAAANGGAISPSTRSVASDTPFVYME